MNSAMMRMFSMRPLSFKKESLDSYDCWITWITALNLSREYFSFNWSSFYDICVDSINEKVFKYYR